MDVHKEISTIDESKDEILETRLTGLNLVLIIIDCLKKLNLDSKYCIGLTTDGCSVMTSESCRIVATVEKECSNAVYSPCHNHILNLSISKSLSVQSVRNAVGTMKETIAFFTASSKRSYTLKNILGYQLSGLCETRWIERHDGVLQFCNLLPKIIDTLDAVSLWKDINTAAKIILGLVP